MELLRVTEADAEELVAIYAPYVLETAVSFETEVPSVEEFAERIRTISAKYPYIKAVEDGVILGYAYAAAFKWRAAYDWSVESTIYLRGDQKRKGIGKILYNALEESLRDMGILNMNACIGYPRCEDPHLSMDSPLFHEKLGFQLVGRFNYSGCKFGRWYDMIWMEKMLGEHTENPEPVRFGQWKICQ
ncbi:MAG: N-acetyltransferase family protein [Lachnospiraceae bacterium]|nr:N-acetyltransferase family protein [Lachnospiraceae bacterium]